MNAFSPRNYWQNEHKLPNAETVHSNKQGHGAGLNPINGWYRRTENNGWRPVSDQVWMDMKDPLVYKSAIKKVKFHYNKVVRREEMEKAKKKKRVEWMKKL